MKKKAFKKAGAAILTMAMLVSAGALSLPVNAAAGDALTVKVSSNYVQLTGIRVYQVAKRNAGTGQWSWNAPFRSVISGDVTFDQLKDLDATQRNNLAKALKYATKVADQDALSKTLVSTTNNAAIASVAGGVNVSGEAYYLVIPESANNDNVFQPSLVAINSQGTSFTELTAKANPLPLVKKIIATEPGELSQAGDPSDTSVGVFGSSIEYQITSQLPEYFEMVTADRVRDYVLTDDPSEGIKINNDDFSAAGSNVKVYFDNDDVTDLVAIAKNGDGFRITVDGETVLDNQGRTVTVTFNAVVDTDAVTGDDYWDDYNDVHQGRKGNPNTVILNWGNNYATGGYLDPENPDKPFEPGEPDTPVPFDPTNPNDQPDEPDTPPEKKSTVTTYVGEIKLVKQAENSNRLLSGAKFKLEGVDNDLTATYTTNSNGTFNFGYLPAGTYRLTETKAPAGYKTISSSYQFTVTNKLDPTDIEFGTYTVTEVEEVEKVEMTDLSDKGNDSSVKITVTDPPADTLPATGGIGTVLFTVGGAAIIILAGVFFVMYMKKRRAED